MAIALVACAPASVTSGGSGGSGGSSKGGSGGESKGGSGGGDKGGSGGGSGGSAGSGGTTNKGGSGGNAGSGGTTNKGGSGGSAGSGGTTNKGGSGGGSGGSAGSGGTTNKGGSGGGAGGGPASGGTAAGGTAAGGTAAGGTAAGGTAGGGGGEGGGGGGSTGDRPPGYFKTSDWKVSSVDWHGCVWTGKDSDVSGSTTSVTPVDFLTGTPDGGPYSVKGTVYNDYNAVALMGFNLNEAITGAADQCKNDPNAGQKDGPPNATIPSSATGIAIAWSAKVAPVTSFRIQIQGIKGGSDATQRWCATISDATGPSFVKFSDFNTKCWDNSGTAYKNEPIDAVVFLVPGHASKKADFDFTIYGFAPGTSKDQAPAGGAACGTMTGSVGSATASQDASMQRAAVTGTDCKKYIINNNNWGQPTSTTQILDFVGSSFTIKNCSGSGSGSGVVSFPSIYIGANGQIANGTFDTWSDSGLPKAISSITSGKTTFTWSGGKSGGNYNAAYDIWFAKSKPNAGGYNDAPSGFIMIWLYKPGSSQPIGQSTNTRPATIGGTQFDVWRGPRNASAAGTDGSGRPVISYVAKSTMQSFSGDLKAFFDDAVANGSADMSAGSGITQAFSNSWMLTDVFAGFEIWNGGDAVGLKGSFACEIK